jgi:hypothetical protein
MEEEHTSLEEEENIYEINSDFPFTKISLENPEPISNGIYFIRLSIENKPLYIQLPKCYMKNGIISTNKKEKYCDLMYSHKDHRELIEWIEQMEMSCKDMIDNKKCLWFQSELSRDDIDNMMTPLYRLYKSGVNVLIRTYIDVNKHNGKPKCLIYDEDENEMDISSVDNSQQIIPLLHIEGIRFSSKTFELDIKLSQMMVMNIEEKEKPNCLIKKDRDKEKDDTYLGKKIQVSFADADALALADDGCKTTENKNENKDKDNSIYLAPPQGQTDVKPTQGQNEVKFPQVQTEVKPTQGQTDVKPTQGQNEVKFPQVQTEVKSLPQQIIENEELIEEVSLDNLDTLNKSDVLELKKPNQVYYKIYKAARRKAIKMRQKAVEAFLEAKQIKTKYMLQDLDDSDDSDNIDEDYSDTEI